MVAQSHLSANRDLAWPRLLAGKYHERAILRSGPGIGKAAACWAAEQGYFVLAMLPIDEAMRKIEEAIREGKEPPSKKQPIEKWSKEKWGEEAVAAFYRTPEQIRDTFRFRRRCGTAILTGESGLVVVDLDSENGEEWLRKLARGREINTRILQTRNGRHLIFKAGHLKYKTQSGEIADGVDIRGHRGIEVIYDPSQPDRHFTDLTEPALVPEWLSTELPRAGSRGHKRSKSNGRVSSADLKRIAGETIPPGQHHDWLISRALSLVNKGWTAKDREDWYAIASAALSRSSEGTDANGHAREPFTKEQILDCFDTALEKYAAEGNAADDDSEEDPFDEQYDNFFSADDVEVKAVEWLNDPFLPFGCLVIIDGDPGDGKSSITSYMVARAASGFPVLPFGEPGPISGEELHCGMIGAEDDIERVVVSRLVAAGYTRNQHIWFMGLSRDAKGNIQLLTFPKGIERVRRFIEKYKLRLVIVDPISAFIGEDISSHNEASVRRALQPLNEVARETGCCIVLVRHLSKDNGMKAIYRGTGSIAFSAIARSGIITGRHPETGSLAIAQVKCSYSEQFSGVVSYEKTRWEKDPSVVAIEWGEVDEDMTADDIVTGPKAKRGPSAEMQEKIKAVLGSMFDKQDTWDSNECADALREAGISTNSRTIKKAALSMGIRPSQVFGEDGRLKKWVWTTKKVSIIREGR